VHKVKLLDEQHADGIQQWSAVSYTSNLRCMSKTMPKNAGDNVPGAIHLSTSTSSARNTSFGPPQRFLDHHPRVMMSLMASSSLRSIFARTAGQSTTRMLNATLLLWPLPWACWVRPRLVWLEVWRIKLTQACLGECVEHQVWTDPAWHDVSSVERETRLGTWGRTALKSAAA
jgi:hypothetical protein